MKIPLRRVISTAAVLGAMTLAGCASGTGSTDGPAGAVLQAANQRALAGSFQVAFSGQLQVDLSGVTPPAGVTAGELSLVQSAINSTELTGVAQVQNSKEVSLTVSLKPLLTQTWHVLYLAGSEYISDNGTQWHEVPASSSSKAAAGDAGQYKSDFKTWGDDLRNDVTVTKLGTTTIAGEQVEHIQTAISGANLNQALATILSQALGGLGSQGASLKSDLPAIEGLIQFTQVKSDSYVLTSDGDLVRTDVTAGLTIDLSQLAALDPAQPGLPTGSVPITATFTANFSDYGQDFNLSKPSHIVAGPVPAPSGLGSAFGLV